MADPALYQQGARGGEVTLIQQALVAAGYPVTVDGIYGRGTAGAVMAFQQNRGITPADGVIRLDTLEALTGSGGFEPEVITPGGAGVDPDGTPNSGAPGSMPWWLWAAAGVIAVGGLWFAFAPGGRRALAAYNEVEDEPAPRPRRRRKRRSRKSFAGERLPVREWITRADNGVIAHPTPTEQEIVDSLVKGGLTKTMARRRAKEYVPHLDSGDS